MARQPEPASAGEQASAGGTAEHRPWYDSARWLGLLGAGVVAGTMLLGSFALYETRNDTWEHASQNAGNLSLALDRDIARNLTILDLSLRGVIDSLAEPGIDDVSIGIRRHALFDSSASAEDLGSILVLNRDGNVAEDSTSVVPHTLNLRDRDYFQIHAQSDAAGLFISRSFMSRLSGRDLRFAISRRLNAPDGSFDGVVMASLRLNYFQRLFEKLNIGKRGTIVLLRTDGQTIYRYPFRPQDLDVDVSKRASNLSRLLAQPAGQFVGRGIYDGVERLITFRQVGDLPLILVVSLSTDEILDPWWHKAALIGIAMTLLCGCAVASSLLFRRELIRRTSTEGALAAAAQQLSVLASTDALTGLMNRRAFDLEYNRSFREAVRSGQPLTVLMIDADCFKSFNDTMGHAAGDEVLRQVANCLAAGVRRPADRAARYGGEEFVCILPGTDAASGRGVAERIRLGVRALHLEHGGSPFGVVTVSIGCATAMPLVGDDPARLLALADANLYAAKHGGRDQVCGSDDTGRHGADLAAIARATLVPQPTAPSG